jgi:hypothetical protein
MNPHIRRAEEAKRLLSEPMLGEAFDNVESGLVGAMKVSIIGDDKTHHELVLCLQLLGRVRNYFQEVIDTGKMEQLQEDMKGKK